MHLSQRAENALQRCGLLTLKDIFDHWDDLREVKARVKDPDKKSATSGLGKTSETEIRAAAFNLMLMLCGNATWDIDSYGTPEEMYESNSL